MDTPVERRRHRAALVIILLIGAMLRLALGWQRPLWIDEVYRLAWAHGCHPRRVYDVDSAGLCINRRPRRTADVLAAVRPYEPPLNAVVLNRWMRATGATSDLAIRLLPIGFSVLAIAGMYLAALEVLGPRAGLIAAALVAVSPFHVYYGEEINNYALASCAAVWALLFYLRWLRRARTADAIAYGLCTIGAFLTHYYTLLAFLAQLVALPVYLRGRRLLRAAIPFAVVATMVACYLPVLIRQLPYIAAQPSGPFAGLELLGRRGLTTVLFPWLGELAERVPTSVGLGLAAFVATLFWSGIVALRQPRLRGVLALNALVPPLLVGAAYLLSRNNLILWPRYGLFFTFAALIPIAGLWAAPPWDLRRWMAAAFVGGLLASGLAFLFLGQEHPDWRQVTQTIVRHGERQEGVIVHKQNLVFELGRYLPAGWRMFGIGPETTLPLRVAAAADGRTGMWAAFAWDQDSDTQARIRRMLECRFGFRDDYPLHLIALSRYHDGPASAETRPTVCGPPNGFVLDGGECVIDPAAQTLSVQGWVDIADSRSALRVTLDGEDGGDAVRGTAAPDVRTPPTAPGATRVWFTRSIDTTQLPDGSLLPLTLVVAPPDGPPETAKETLLCVKRSGTAIAGTPGTRVVAGWLGTPTRGKRFRSGTPMWVSGWAFATTGITHIVLQIDGREVLRSRQHGFARPEVGTLYPTLDPDLTNSSGFAVRLDTSGIAPGRHELRAACVLPDGSSVPLPPVRRFDVIAAPSS